MLFRVLSEIIVCAVASFEKCELWINETPQPRIVFNHACFDEFKKMAINRENSEAKPARSTQRTINSYFSQQPTQASDIIMRIYGEDLQKKTSQSHHYSWHSMGGCCDHPDVSVIHDLLYSFDCNGDFADSVELPTYMQYTSAYFCETLRHIYSQYPTQFDDLLQQRPYLYFLRFGEYSLCDVVNHEIPASLLSFTLNTEQLSTLFQLVCKIPELSLEVVPAMGYMSIILRHSQKTYQQWIQPLTIAPSIVQLFYAYCIRLSSIAVFNQSKHTQLLIGEVLGLLGALAPERFESRIHENTIQPLLTDFDLALIMIERFFVKDLMGLPKRDIQNRIALTVQRLLRFLQNRLQNGNVDEITMNNENRIIIQNSKTVKKVENDSFPTELKGFFTEEELSVISQYWKTEYAVRKEGTDHSQGFEGISVKNYAKWITKCSLRLIALCPKEEQTSTQATPQKARSSTIEMDSNSSVSHIETISNESVIYIFRTLLSPLCADRASFLFPHIIQFALFYHYNHWNGSGNDSSSTTPVMGQNLSNMSIPFFETFADYCNDMLSRCDIASDNETQHCCSDLLAAVNTLQSWASCYQLRSLRERKPAYKAKAMVIRYFISLLNHRQIIRVAKLLGQHEMTLK